METYTDANTNTVLTHPTRGTVEMAFLTFAGVVSVHTAYRASYRGQSMEPEQKDRETNRARQNVLGIHTGTEFILWHSL